MSSYQPNPSAMSYQESSDGSTLKLGSVVVKHPGIFTVTHNPAIQKGINTELGVLPVVPGMIHHGYYEGPCRPGGENVPTTQEEARANQGLAEEVMSAWKDMSLSAHVNKLAPVTFEYDDTWVMREEEYAKIEKHIDEVDAFLILNGTGLSQIPAVAIGERFGKPVIFLAEGARNPFFPMGVDASSHLRASGLESYVTMDEDELDRLLHMLQVRKAVKSTRLLRVVEHTTDNVNGNFTNVDHLKERFGFGVHDIGLGEMVSEFDRNQNDPSAQARIQSVTDQLIKSAKAVHMTRENLEPSVAFYVTAESLMAKYDCNAFTIHCFEMCPDRRLANDRKATPCLTHTLLRDAGVPSVCEADMNLLVTVVFFVYLAQRSVHMGNLFVNDRRNNVLEVMHDVPGLKMLGFDQPDLPFELRNFTYSGWGATVRYDFARDKGQAVTLGRFDPKGEKLLVTRGEIVGGAGMDQISCSLRAFVKVRDLDDFFHKAAAFGNHTAVLYDDYTEQLKRLGEIIPFEVVEC